MQRLPLAGKLLLKCRKDMLDKVSTESFFHMHLPRHLKQRKLFSVRI